MNRAPRALGLSVPSRTEAYAVAAAVFAVFAASASRDLSFYDSGELALAAVQGGLGHPTGQPLHTLLGHAVTAVLPAAWALPGLSLLSALAAVDGHSTAADAAPRVLFDPNVASSDATVALARFQPSPDGKTLAYSLSDGGTDWEIWKFRRVVDGVDLVDELRYHLGLAVLLDGLTLEIRLVRRVILVHLIIEA